MNKIQQHDIKEFLRIFTFADDFDDCTFLITGATGLIGSTMIHCLLALNRVIKIIAPVRNISKAKVLFSKEELRYITLFECDITKTNYAKFESIDYIVHCAAPTSSKFFVEYPVETFDVIYNATKVLLDYAKTKNIKGFIYLSSLEVYGEINDDTMPITEDVQGYLDVMSIRSSYPMAKRAAENLCCLYSSEYNVPVKIARLTQTMGAGISKEDNRIMAQFARLVSTGKDIVLHTIGDSARPYCYTIDAISAILYILLKGKIGEAYNVANEDTYISARKMAEYLRDNFNPQIVVRLELDEHMGYAPSTKHRLSTQKLMSLGWIPHYGLFEIFTNLIAYLKS